jgi:putative oxidoreductase
MNNDMQRLYTTFPNEWPGAGLLLLRLAEGIPSLLEGTLHTLSSGATLATLPYAADILSGLLLTLGFWTPIGGLLQALVEFSSVLAGDGYEHIVRGMIGLSLAMLGPGAWSVDARLFGRKRIDVTVLKD